jgi:hypothetical protein
MEKGDMRKTILACLALVLLCMMFTNVNALIVIVDIELPKSVYSINDTVVIAGSMTADGDSVNNAVVAISVIAPAVNGSPNEPYVFRTLRTGAGVGFWKVVILNVSTCDEYANPKTLFYKGGNAFIDFSFKNIDTLDHYVKAAVYVQYSDNTPMNAFYPFAGNVIPQQEIRNIVSLPIPSSAITGQALVFVSLFSNDPEIDGYAYCPEETTFFYIGATTPLAPPQPEYFNMSFKIPKKDVKLGMYGVYARARWGGMYTPTDYESFNLILIGDIVRDNRIDMRDISAICALFGKREGDPGWNPDADLYPDGKIDMRDISIACANFGATGIA